MIAVLASTVLFGAEQKMPDSRLRNSEIALREIMGSPDRGIPRDLIDKAQCVVIVPDLLKGAFVVGGKYGRGYAMCRRGNGWSAPAAMRIEGGSFGFQLGGSSTDLIMLVMNRRGMDRLLGDKFTIGGEAAAAAGPVGRQTTAQTDIAMHAEILSWSRSRGLFAGISLDGATLHTDKREDRRLYGREMSNREILMGDVRPPSAARPLVAELDRISRSAPVQTAEAGEVHKNVRRARPSIEALRQPGGRVVLSENQIHFATGQYAVPQGAEAVLGEIATMLKENPSWKIRIEGFTDNVGSAELNRHLSEQRAHAVRDWLAGHGVNRDQMIARGYGASRPIASNSDAEGRAANRRVEIVRVGTVQAPTGF
jgi:lipid-binding SYLF domain-containing protein